MNTKKWKTTATIGGKRYSEEKFVDNWFHETEKVNDILPFTLFEAFDLYIEDLKVNSGLTASTIKNYENIRDNHFASIMNRVFDALTEADYQEALNKEVEMGYSIKTVKSYRRLLLKVIETYKPDFQVNLEIAS